MRILILDDCWEDMRPNVLQNNPEHDFVFVGNPKAAEATMEQETFDVLLLDGRLGWNEKGPITGPDTLRRWKSEGRALPRIYMFSSDEKYQHEGILAGAAGSLSKDWLKNPNLLRQTLEGDK